MSYKFKNVES